MSKKNITNYDILEAISKSEMDRKVEEALPKKDHQGIFLAVAKHNLKMFRAVKGFLNK